MPCSVSSDVSRPSDGDGDATLDLLPVLQALADPSRLRIVHLLREREQCVCHLTEALDVKQSTISHHMGVLKRAGIVVDRRDDQDARWVYYALSPDARGLGRRIASVLDTEGVSPARADCSNR